jgi:hypothetical protein
MAQQNEMGLNLVRVSLRWMAERNAAAWRKWKRHRFRLTIVPCPHCHEGDIGNDQQRHSCRDHIR